jgi:membrane fusion protein, heavy metal efflux system
MKRVMNVIGLMAIGFAISACDWSREHGHGHDEHDDHGEAEHEEVAKGPHGGRLLIDGEFSLELALFETGVPPEFRVWVTEAGAPIAPEAVDLTITLTRLGDVKDKIAFNPQDDFLRGDTVIYEPHSFVVTVEAHHGNATHRWQYDNFEGRTLIGPEIATAFGLETEIADPATIRETVTVYGRVVPNAEKVRRIDARFAGAVESVAVSVGDRVTKGQTLAKVESNESLTLYAVTAPIDGMITERNAYPGEQTGDRALFTVMDTTSVWVEFAVFSRDLSLIKQSAPVRISASDGSLGRAGEVSYISPIAGADQSVVARVTLDNTDGTLVPGMFVTGEIQVAEHNVPLAVKRSGLQGFRDFTVVYAQIGDQYEVRMLELGRQDDEWIEVLGGLPPGTRYVTTNSYLVKADIEKSGASHDH